MPASSLGRRRSRPVADAPALDGADLAKAWLVELVALAPLERAARLPGPRFAEDAPRLCAAVAAALASDPALEDLEPGGTLAPLAAGSGHLAAAPTPLEAINALDALRAVTWAALLDAVDRPVPAQIAELADRLGAIIAALATAALESPHPMGAIRPGDRGPLAAVLRDARDEAPPDHAAPAPASTREASHDVAASSGAPSAPPESEAPSSPPEFPAPSSPSGFEAPTAPVERTVEASSSAPWGSARPTPLRPSEDPPRHPLDEALAGARDLSPTDDGGPRVVVDDASRRADRPPLRSVPLGEEDARRTTPAGEALAQIEATLRDAAHAADPLADAAARLRALAQTTDLDAPASDPFDLAATRLRSSAPPLAEPRIRRMPAVEDGTDLRGARVTPWAASIERRLARHRADALPFAVLCLEVVDAERLLAADADREMVEALERVEAAVLGQLRPADALVREQPGRYWLTTPDTDATDGRALAHRVAAAVAELPPHRGVPFQVAVGVSTCPADGADALTLEASAEQGLFAARAAGLRVAGPPS